MKPIPTTLITSFSDLTHKHRQTLMIHTNRHKFTNLYHNPQKNYKTKNPSCFPLSHLNLFLHTLDSVRFYHYLTIPSSFTTLQNQPSSALSYFSLLFFLRLWRKLKDSKVSSSLHRLELARSQEQNRFSRYFGKIPLSLGLITYIIHRCLWQFFPT